MRIKNRLIAATFLASTATFISPTVTAADEGFYAGVTVGQGKTDNVATNTTMTSSSSTVAGILGGYQFTKNLGVEAFYTQVGKYTAVGGGATINGKAAAFGVVAIGSLQLSNTFSIYGKLGIANTKNSVSSVPASNASGASRTTGTFGLGGQYNVTPAVGIRLGWDRYGEALNVSPLTNEYNADVLSLGAVFKL